MDNSAGSRPPSPGKDRPLWQRPWLPGWGAAANGDAAELQPGGLSSRLSISVAGQGLACCTSARVQVLGGAFLPARIVAQPPLTSLQAQRVPGAGSQAASSPSAPPTAGSQTPLDAARTWRDHSLQWGRALLSAVPRLSASPVPAQRTPGESEEAPEKLEVEVLLPPGVARSLADSLTGGGQPGAGALAVQLRSDFHRRRARVALVLPAAWVLGDAAPACRALLDGLGGGGGCGEASGGGGGQQAFGQAICDNVRYLGLQADAQGGAASLAAAGQLAARALQANGVPSGAEPPGAEERPRARRCGRAGAAGSRERRRLGFTNHQPASVGGREGARG